MRLPRAVVVEGYPAELERFEELIRSLSDEQWQASSPCEGWRVADVAAHVSGTLVAIVEGRTAELADPDHVERQVEERRNCLRDELADEFAKAAASTRVLLDAFDDESWSAPVPGDVAPSVGEGVEALWYDTYVHAEDIRASVGMPSDQSVASRTVAVAHLADVLQQQGWGPATLALDGIEEFTVGAGGGRRITGDPGEFILAATGRVDPATLGLDETVNVYR